MRLQSLLNMLRQIGWSDSTVPLGDLSTIFSFEFQDALYIETVFGAKEIEILLKLPSIHQKVGRAEGRILPRVLKVLRHQ